MRLAIADPPYLGQGVRHYGDHHPQSHLWDDPQTHLELMAQLHADFDGWVIATHTPGLGVYLPAAPPRTRTGVWVKTRAGGSRPNVRVGYSHEFTVFQPARRGGQAHMSRTDVLMCAATQKRGLVGAKPERWTWWVLDLLGYEPGDEVVDLFPGTGAVSDAVKSYRRGCRRCGGVISTSRRADAVWCSSACRQAGYRRASQGKPIKPSATAPARSTSGGHLVPVSAADAVEFVESHHYTRAAAPGVARYGWEHRGELVGVSIFDTGNHAMRQAPFGAEHTEHVLHHHRLALTPGAEKMTASRFLAASLRALVADRPETWAVVTYADLCQGHHGTIYQATNAVFTGIVSKGNLKFRTSQGQIVPTQSLPGTWPQRRAAAAQRGWEEIRCLGKARYVYLLGTPSQRRRRPALLWSALPYPAGASTPQNRAAHPVALPRARETDGPAATD